MAVKQQYQRLAQHPQPTKTSSSLSDDYVSESSIVHLVDKAKADIATGSSLSFGSQTAIPTSCATSTTDEDFIWSSSLSDDYYVSESSIVHLVDKAKADIANDPELQVRLDVLEKELTEDIAKLNQTPQNVCRSTWTA